MAEIVLGIGTSHSPMLSQPPHIWPEHAKLDQRSRELAFAPSGIVKSFESALATADPSYAALATQERFNAQHAACQEAIQRLASTIENANVDVVVIISDDQDELFFEDNMPTFAVYWGDSIPIYKRRPPESAPLPIREAAWGYGDDMDVRVNPALGWHLIQSLNDAEFDIAHFRYLREVYGGENTRYYPREDGEAPPTRTTDPRRMGLPHGFAFVIKRIFENKDIPIVPVFQNTCYPPNQPTPGRCYDLGVELARAIRSWECDARVAVIASGGLSHFTVDEELDRMLLDGLARSDRDSLRSIPRNRLHSAASETLNWVTLGGAMSESDLGYELVDYVPVYRTAAGTGGGWAFTRWT